MQKMIKAIIFLFYLFLATGHALAQTASLLPQGRIQFFDNNGNPLAGGKVYNYVVGTTTFKTTWQDSGESVANTNPIILDSAGRALIYGQGAYRQIVRDANNNLIWDAVTSAIGGGGGSSATGDGDLVGTVKPWAGLSAPNQYAFAFGQELSRATYSSLLAAITLSTNVTCTSASNTLTAIGDTSSINVGAAIEATCVPAGTTVVSKTSSTVVVSNPASLSVTVSGRFFPFGNGDGSTTFNVPDLRGYVLAGRDNMGGVAASRLTTTYFGSNTPDALNASGGAQSTTIAQANLPSANLTTTIAAGQGAHTHTATTNAGVQSTQAGAGGATFMVSGTATVTVNSATLPQMTGTTPLGGSGTAISRIQPTVTMNYIIKVTPDTNSSIATGVTDIDGMTGSIACGVGLLCTGNSISVTGVASGDVDYLLQGNGLGFDASFKPLSSANLDFICSTNDASLVRSSGTWGCLQARTTITNNVTGSVNDYSPTGYTANTGVIRVTSTGTWNITGIVAQTTGDQLWIMNVGTTGKIVLKNNDGASVAANQMTLGNDVVLQPNGGYQCLMYDSSSVWRPCSAPSAFGGALYINSTPVLDFDGTYTLLRNDVGNNVICGNAGDPTCFFRNTNIRLESLAANNFVTWTATGALIGTGTAAQSLVMTRQPTANTAGNALSIIASGATSGATDKNGGQLTLSCGISTGSGLCSVVIQVATPGGSGTTDRNPATIASFTSGGLALASGAGIFAASINNVGSNLVIGTGVQLANNATTGFPLLCGINGTPIGAPGFVGTGTVAFCFDSTNDIPYWNRGSGWIATITASGTQTLSNKTLSNPTFSGTVSGNNTIPLTILAQSAANTMLGNWTSGAANVTANAMPSCSDTLGQHLNYVSGTGIICGTSVPTQPTVQRFTSGSGTYTRPTAPTPTRIVIFMVGAGGGGAGGGTGGVPGGNGGNGGNTCWNTSGAACTTPVLQAGGGTGATAGTGVGGAGGTTSGSGSFVATEAGQIGGTSITSDILTMMGAWGGNSCKPGVGQPGLGLTAGVASKANSGAGGSGGGATNTTNMGAGGGGGACGTAIINAPASSYTYAVGAAGTAGTAGGFSSAGLAGGSGLIEVWEYYN